jgi:beta-N-acetylhexosaminidase
MTTTRRAFLAVVLALGLAGAGCGSAASETSGAPRATVSAAAAACAERALGRMSLAQRVGQLFLVGVPAPASGGLAAQVSGAIRGRHFGSVLFVGNSTAGAAGVRAVTRAVQSLAVGGVRFLVAANQEGGQIQPLRGPGFATIPSAVAQGEMSVAELRREATAWGRELASAGVNLDLAPVLDVVPPGTASENAPIGMLEREYGGQPGPVADHGVAFVDGMRAAGVATTAKHFPGLGRVRSNTDFTANVVDTATTATDPYLGTYRAAIEAGVPFVMVALATYTRIDPRHLAAFSSRVITGLLRQRLGFQGVIVSDDLGAAAAVAALPAADRAIGFLDAGGDMITSASIQVAAEMAQAVLRKAEQDKSFRALVDAAARRILGAKQEAGLVSCYH